MKIGFADYSKKLDASVLVAMAVFKVLQEKYPSKKISEIAETTSGGTPSRTNAEFYNGEIAWLKSGELNDGIISKAEETITELGLKNSSAKLFPKGTLLIAMYGATTGKVGILDIEATTNQAVCALFPNNEIERDFLFWFLRQHRYEFIRISRGGAQPNISQTVINQASLPIPPIDEQRKISRLLTEIEKERKVDENLIEREFLKEVNKFLHLKENSDGISTELSHQLDLVSQLRQTFLREAMQGKLVPQEEADEPAEILLEKIKAEKEKLIAEKKIKRDKSLPEIKAEEISFEIPSNWTWCRLGEIAQHNSGKTKDSGRNQGELREYITTSNLYWGFFDLEVIPKMPIQENDLERCVAIKGDLLVCEGGEAGRAAIWELEREICFQNHIHRVRPYGNVNSYYLFHFFQHLNSSGDINNYRKGMGISNLSGKSLSSIILPLPPLAEQKRIVAKLDTLMKFCDELETNIRESKSQAESLLQVALKEALEPKEELKISA